MVCLFTNTAATVVTLVGDRPTRNLHGAVIDSAGDLRRYF